MLRKVAIAVGILLAGAVAALVVVVAFFDFNRLKPLITARVADYSGRQLRSAASSACGTRESCIVSPARS